MNVNEEELKKVIDNFLCEIPEGFDSSCNDRIYEIASEMLDDIDFDVNMVVSGVSELKHICDTMRYAEFDLRNRPKVFLSLDKFIGDISKIFGVDPSYF